MASNIFVCKTEQHPEVLVAEESDCEVIAINNSSEEFKLFGIDSKIQLTPKLAKGISS